MKLTLKISKNKIFNDDCLLKANYDEYYTVKITKKLLLLSDSKIIRLNKTLALDTYRVQELGAGSGNDVSWEAIGFVKLNIYQRFILLGVKNIVTFMSNIKNLASMATVIGVIFALTNCNKEEVKYYPNNTTTIIKNYNTIIVK